MLVVQERDASNVVTRGAVWGLSLGGGIGGLLNLAQAGQYYSYLYDGSGNVEAVLNSSQAVVAAYRYDPFGNLQAKTGALTQPYGFSTKRYDAALGVIHYEARKYWTALGTWGSRDPLGEAGGLNLYAFVGNNPVNWVDPYGESAVLTWGTLVSAGGGTSTFAAAAPYAFVPIVFYGGWQAGTWLNDTWIAPMIWSPGGIADTICEMKGERNWGRRRGDDWLWELSPEELREIEKSDPDPNVRQRAKKIRKMKEKERRKPTN